MPNPKRQHSRQRRNKRRTHWKIQAASLNKCSSCGKPILSHRVCPFCGMYKGKQVVDMSVKEDKKAEGTAE